MKDIRINSPKLIKLGFNGLCPFCRKENSPEFCDCLNPLQKDEFLSKPPVSEAQRKAMGAAASGHSTLGIPKKVGKEFIEADTGGKLPAKKGEGLNKVSPPGREKQVKALKNVAGIKNPWAVAWASKNKAKKAENGVAGGAPPGIDAQTDMLMAENSASTSTSDENGSHSVSVSESSDGDIEVRTRQNIKKDEDLNDADAFTHQAKIKGKVPMRRKENPPSVPNNTVTAPETEGRTGMTDGSGFIKPTSESVKAASDAINKDELDKMGTNRTMPSTSLKEKVNQNYSKFTATGRESGPGNKVSSHPGTPGGIKAAPAVERKFSAKMGKADSFPHDANNPLLESYKKPNRLQQIQKADPMWLREKTGTIEKASMAPPTPAPAKPTSPPMPKPMKMPKMSTMTKNSKLGTPKGDALADAYKEKPTVTSEPKTKLPSPKEQGQRRSVFEEFTPAGKFGKR